MRFTIDHPTDTQIHADYGFDAALGYFVSVVIRGTYWDYDAVTPGYSAARPLHGALLFLIDHGFYTLDELQAALLWIERHGNQSPPKRLRIPIEVVSSFMIAGD